MSTRIHPVIVVVLLFAVVGFIFELITNPIYTLLMIGLCALVLFLLHTYMKTGRFLPSRLVMKPKEKPAPKTTKKTSTPRKNVPFQVIEGSKGKSKPKEKPKDRHFHR